MKALIFKATLIISSVLVTFGCNPKKDATRSTNINSTNNVVSINTNTSCATQTASKIGTIYDLTSNSIYFEQRVKDFLSTHIDPNEIGYISSNPSDSTGVRFEGIIKADSAGNISLGNSKMSITVYDSYVAYNSNYQPIKINFAQAAEGKIDMQTGVGYVIFRDSAGEVRFDGTLSASQFSGNISFKNLKHYSNQTPAQGQLGQFSVARCGLFQ